MNSITRGMIAEFIGTFALMFVGGGAIVMTAASDNGGGGLIAVALAHGLILAVMISATMHISGGQINPAVSIGLLAIGKQSASQTAAFVLAQTAGSVIAALLLVLLLGPLHAAAASGGSGEIVSAIEQVKIGATLPSGGSWNAGWAEPSVGLVAGLELIATFFLVFVVIGTAVDARGVGRGPLIGGFGIGLTVAADILAIGPVTGASMNPARSFGPALASTFTGIEGAWEMHWVYWLAPIGGGVLAALVWQYGIGLASTPSDDSASG